MRQWRKRALIGLMAITGMLRLGLVNRGHYFFQDELRFRYSLAFIRELSQGNVVEAVRQMYERHLMLRPGLVLVNLPAVILQSLLFVLTGIKTESPTALTIPSVINVLVSLGIIYIFFQLAYRLTRSFKLSLTAMLVYAGLVNTNVYLRHIVPYDVVLLAYLIGLNELLQLKSDWAKKKLVTLGAMTGFTLSIYPGYFTFPIILVLVLWCIAGKHKVNAVTRFIGSGGAVYSSLVAIGLLVNPKFGINTLDFATGGQTVGDFNETVIFGLKYLMEAEGPVGIVLSIMFLTTLMLMLIRPKIFSVPQKLVVLIPTSLYLGYSIVAITLHKLVFYGRLWHMYVPFVVLGAVILVKSWPRMGQNLAVWGLMATVAVSLIKWYPQYLNLDYPYDALYRYCGADCSKVASLVNESFAPDSKMNYYVPNPNYWGINFDKSLLPVGDRIYTYSIPSQATLVYQQAHPLEFVAYQFDGHTPAERQRLRSRNYQMKLYRLE